MNTNSVNKVSVTITAILTNGLAQAIDSQGKTIEVTKIHRIPNVHVGDRVFGHLLNDDVNCDEFWLETWSRDINLSHEIKDNFQKVTVINTFDNGNGSEIVAVLQAGYDEGGESEINIKYQNGYDYPSHKHFLVRDYVHSVVNELTVGSDNMFQFYTFEGQVKTFKFTDNSDISAWGRSEEEARTNAITLVCTTHRILAECVTLGKCIKVDTEGKDFARLAEEIKQRQTQEK